jgi:opacity protein-like surface antigen
MKRSVFGVAMALALVATAATAQSVVPAAKPVSFGIAGGMSVPTGDFGDGFKSGYNVSGLVQFQQPTWPVALRIEAQYQDFGAKGGVDASAKTIGGLANVIYAFPTKSTVRPYVTGGLGYFHLKMDMGDVSGSDNKFGFDFGAGLDFQLSGMNTFIEANWQSVRAEGAAMNQIPVRVGIRF